METYQALIFDLDGVIIDTESLHTEAKRIAFRKYALPVPEDLYPEFRGRSDQDMADHVVKTFGSPDHSSAEVAGYKHEIFDTLQERILPVEGVLEFIRESRMRFEKLAVATSATEKNQRFAFEKFGLWPFFDAVVHAGDLEHTKPNAEPYVKIAEKLGLPPKACLVIEDSRNGILSAKGAGCKVVAITTTFTRMELLDAEADYIVESFKELAELLKF